MKTYMKPMLHAFSLTGNERLCGSCANKNAFVITSDPTLLALLGEMYGGADGTLTKQEYESLSTFGNEAECTNLEMDIASFCKFTAAETNLVAWS